VNSPANKTDAPGCRWNYDGSGWCEWNSTDLPSQGGSGIIDNIWISDQNASWFEAVIDRKCWLGNCSSPIRPGMYFIIVKMGGTRMNVSVNNTYFEQIDNEFGNWGWFSTSNKYSFTDNVTYLIELFDDIGPDYLNWTINVGEPEESPDNISLSLSLDDINASVEETETAVLRINLTNNGTKDAENISIIYMFDQNYMNITGASVQWNHSSFAMFTNGSVEWWVSLNAGENISIEVNVTAINSGSPEHRVRAENSSGHLFAEGYVNLTINPASGSLPQIIVNKYKYNSSVKEGQIAEFRLNVTNIGTGDAENFTILDLFNSTYLYYYSSNVTCDNITDNMVSWIRNITAGQTLLIHVNMTANNSGIGHNNLSVDNGTEIIESFEVMQNILPADSPDYTVFNYSLMNNNTWLVENETLFLDLYVTMNGTVNASNITINLSFDPIHFETYGANPGFGFLSDTFGYAGWTKDFSANSTLNFQPNFTAEKPVLSTTMLLWIRNSTGHVLNFTSWNISINLTLFGNVNSSLGHQSDAIVRIRNKTTKTLIAEKNTTSNGYYNLSLIPAQYDLEYVSPLGFLYPCIVKVFDVALMNSTNISIDLPEVDIMNIALNDTIVNYSVYIETRNSTNNSFNVEIHNIENFTMNVSLNFNASETGDSSAFDYLWTNVPSHTAENLSYNFGPNIIGAHNLTYSIGMGTSDISRIVFGYSPGPAYEMMKIDPVHNNNVPINITT
jgi:hypothetical protein